MREAERKQRFLDCHRRRYVNGGGNHVVGALLHVDVGIGMDGLFSAPFPGGDFIRPAGDHLVGVHVGRGARPGLENIDHELRIKLPVNHILGGLLN